MLNNPLRYQDPTGHDGWDKVNSFLMGAACALISIEYDSLLIPSTYPVRQPVEALAVAMNNDDAFQAGRVVVGTVAMAQGVAEMVAGATIATGGAAGGVATSETGVGVVAGAEVVVAGAAVATHGAVVGARGMTEVGQAGSNILQAVTKGGGKGGRNYHFPDRKGLAKYLGVNEDEIHGVKDDIFHDPDIAPLLKKVGDNPDIGWDDAGNIVLKSETGTTVETKVQIDWFKKEE